MPIKGQELGEGPGRLVDDPLGSSPPLTPPTMPVTNIVVLSAADNVGIAVRDIEAGQPARSAEGRGVKVNEAIPLGHKVALEPIPSSARIVRFGVPVGIATADILPGSLVHVHNVKSQYLDNVEDHYE